MKLMNFKKAKKQAFEDQVDRFLHDSFCLENGWTPWVGEVTEEKAKQAHDDLFSGRGLTLYPPGYQEDPVITEGKLHVDPEPDSESKKRGWFW